MLKFLVSAGLILAFSGVVGKAEDALPFQFSAKRDNDRVEACVFEDKMVVSIRCPAGISSLAIERKTEQWPKSVVIQLRLKGLESFTVASDQLKLAVAVSSQNGEVRTWLAGKEESPLDPNSSLRLKVHLLDKDSQPTKVIPLKDGLFQVQLPQRLFQDNPPSISMSWIDFYRN
ncbi:hypothetical protein [Aureliella helgolandensis]|uniref:Uncharacterized protein n=1 Tax=Aureliella helgolandensis TaxID=2527968 RepID=A0A518G1X6_9BACT|nr:hypothetical protein [Aureliella helgolandensis]QDV22574.1 hypothetical protein Q31a_08600 [Aureliella helgolandensis]